MNNHSLALLLLTAGAIALPAQEAMPTTDASQSQFLLKAKVVKTEVIDHGVTKPIRAKLQLGTVTHDAQIQGVDKELPPYFGGGRTGYPNRDSWKQGVAAYQVDRLLGMNMTPVAVTRAYLQKPGCFIWWADNVQMEDIERITKKIQPPDPEAYERQMADVRVFDELILNIDRNLANLLITKDWRIVPIDHTRAFAPSPDIRNDKNLTRISKRLYDSMKAMNTASVTKAVGTNLTQAQIAAMLSRRDKILAFFDAKAAAGGTVQVIFQ